MIQYQELLKRILADGEMHEDRTGVGTISKFGEQIRFDLKEGFPLMTTKRVPLRWVFEELRWFLSGDTNEFNLRSAGVDIWKEWADLPHTSQFGREEGDLGPVYGYLWRSFGGDYPERNGVDQIARALDEIKNKPNSRRILVSGWDAKACDLVTLPPCHTVFQFKVHAAKPGEDRGSLSCHLCMRSCDVFLGLPFNIASYALLTHMMAYVSKLDVKDLIVSFGDAHIYRNHLPQIYTQLSRKPKELPTLSIEPTYADVIQIFGGGLNGLLAIEWKHIVLRGYNPYPSIKAEVAV